MLAWLADIGAGTLESSIPIPEVDTAMVPRTSALLPRNKPAKRRVTEGGEGPAGPRRRMGHGKGGQDENGISNEVQVWLQGARAQVSWSVELILGC